MSVSDILEPTDDGKDSQVNISFSLLSFYLSFGMIFKVVHVLVIYQYMYMCLDILTSKFEIVK